VIQDALCSQEGFDLIKEMLNHDAISRVTPKEALTHPYFTGKQQISRPRRPPSRSSVSSLKATLGGHNHVNMPFHPGRPRTAF